MGEKKALPGGSKNLFILIYVTDRKGRWEVGEGKGVGTERHGNVENGYMCYDAMI